MSYIDQDSLPNEKIRYLSADGSSGACFKFKESKEAPVEEFKKVRFVVLGAWRGNSCWGGANTAFPGQQVICKAHDARRPAQIVGKLGTNESALLESMGWTGDCSTCGIAASKTLNLFKPEQNLVALWHRPNAEPEVVLLNFKGWRSFYRVGEFLKRYSGRNVSDYVIEAEMTKQKSKDGSGFSEPTFTEVETVAPADRQALADLADQHVPAMRHRNPPSTSQALGAPPAKRSLPAAGGAEVIDPDDIPF